MAKTLLDYLKGDVQIAEHKRRMIFDDIHIWQECNGWGNEEVVKCLTSMTYIESEPEAWQWLKKYIEHLYKEEDERHGKVITRLSERNEQVTLKLARRENR